MHIEPRHKHIVEKILKDNLPGIEVRAFGSRVKGTHRPHSDLDLVLVADGKVDLKTIFLLEEAFDESDLPYKVDILDYSRIDESFKKIIDKNYEVIQTVV
tara:strand:+ start:66 stop:365 length:300 start_codon:yes stop_codon:yes gene_type:complete